MFVFNDLFYALIIGAGALMLLVEDHENNDNIIGPVHQLTNTPK